MENSLLVALFTPLIGFLVQLGTSFCINRKISGILGCLSVFVSFALFSSLLASFQSSENVTLFTWIKAPGIQADFSLHLDTLSLLMCLIITGVGFLIHVYSIGYMEEEIDFARYFACMNFFIFSMLLLVLAANLLLLFVGWEGVGLASYLLIGFWYERPKAAKAAFKAFIVNRIGDFGLLLGIILTFFLFGTADIEKVLTITGQKFAPGEPILILLTLLLFMGAVGKSAQIPLHVWLPDAMEGPTPVSALIHAATMVTAGVYLVVRMHPLFLLAPATLQVIGIVGGATAFFAGLSALGQTDLKRILAYSTISQLGYMFLACGAGAFFAAMFHLTSHAFIKALLFLSAGNIVHMLNGATEMDKMGGLSKKLPITNILFFIGVLALSGLPPFAAFFSKDLILEKEFEAGFFTLYLFGLITAFLTGFYLTRGYCLAFQGKKSVEAKEAPPVMLTPVGLLALLSLCGGFFGFALNRFLAKAGVRDAGTSYEFHFTWLIWLSFAVSALGIILAYFLYTRYTEQLGKTAIFLRKAFFVDEIYDGLVVAPTRFASRFIAEILEPKFLDRSLALVAHAGGSSAAFLQKMQSGQIRSYIAWMALGFAFLILSILF